MGEVLVNTVRSRARVPVTITVSSELLWAEAGTAKQVLKPIVANEKARCLALNFLRGRGGKEKAAKVKAEHEGSVIEKALIENVV